MSEVKRFQICGGDWEGKPHEKGEWVLALDFDRVTAERDALQALLTAADERVYVLEGLLREAVKTPWLYDVRGKIMAALKPAEVRCNIPACDYQIDMDQN